MRLFLLFCTFPLFSFSQINTDRVMIMGRNALYYEDYVLSIQRFNMVISAKPFLAEPYFYRGLAKFYLEDYLGADADCGSAIERNPFAENNYVLRGLCRVNMKRYAEAEEDYRKATTISPLDQSCWHNMVLCQMELKKYAEADSSLDVMLRQWPKEPEHYTMKAQVAFAREDTTQALDWLDRALDVNPHEGPAWSMKAMVTLNRGNYKDGEEQLDKAILQMPRNANLYINRALTRYNQQNLRGAMTDYDVALEIEPGNYLGHFNRGLLRAQVGDDNRAIEDFNFVLEQEPDNTIALYNRALLLDQTGDYNGALRDISDVIKDYPEFWEGYRTRAAIRRKLGDTYGAERDEFKVLKAELEKRTGTYKSQGKTRKKSDRNPEDFNKLVEEDQQTGEKQEYASEYRGKVQDKATELTPAPFYLLTYYNKDSGMSSYVPFHRMVDDLNHHSALLRTIHLSDAETSVTEARMNSHFQDITDVTLRIDAAPENAQLYLRRAMDYYHVRDFDAAITDLTRLLAIDSTSAVAYFLRAQMRCAGLQMEYTSLPQSPSAEARIVYGQAMQDLRDALRLVPDLSYAYYNIGNICVRLHDYDQAEQAYTEALRLAPQLPSAYYNRGITRLLDGKTDEALNDLSQAGECGLYSAYNLIKRYSKVKK